MPFDSKLLNLIQCPHCEKDVAYRRQGEIEELVCPHCNQVYKIIQGIPKLVADE